MFSSTEIYDLDSQTFLFDNSFSTNLRTLLFFTPYGILGPFIFTLRKKTLINPLRLFSNPRESTHYINGCHRAKFKSPFPPHN